MRKRDHAFYGGGPHKTPHTLTPLCSVSEDESLAYSPPGRRARGLDVHALGIQSLIGTSQRSVGIAATDK